MRDGGKTIILFLLKKIEWKRLLNIISFWLIQTFLILKSKVLFFYFSFYFFFKILEEQFKVKS